MLKYPDEWFVLAGDGWAFLIRRWDDGNWWRFRYRKHSNGWVSEQQVEDKDIAILRGRALPADQAALYPNPELP